MNSKHGFCVHLWTIYRLPYWGWPGSHGSGSKEALTRAVRPSGQEQESQNAGRKTGKWRASRLSQVYEQRAPANRSLLQLVLRQWRRNVSCHGQARDFDPSTCSRVTCDSHVGRHERIKAPRGKCSFLPIAWKHEIQPPCSAEAGSQGSIWRTESSNSEITPMRFFCIVVNY
jgi:hypothetical protein